MTETVEAELLEADLDKKVLTEQIKTLYESMGSLLLINLVIGVSLVFALWGLVPSTTLLGWLGALMVMLSVRAIYFYGFRKSFEPEKLDHYRRILIYGSGSAGIIWGLAGVLFYIPDQLSYQLFMLVALYSMAGGSVFSLSMYLPAFYAYVPITLLPLAGILLIQGDMLHYILAGVTVTFLLAITTFNNKISQTYQASFRLRYENFSLIEQLTEQKQTADNANKAKSTFLAAASHDLRQPLYALQLFISVLDELTTEKESRHVLGQITRSADALNNLLDSLLDISQLDAGTLKTETIDFSLLEVVQKLSHEFEPRAKEKHLTIQWPDTDETLHSEPVLVEQILRNYLSNAFKFTETGLIRVSYEDKESSIKISVSDTGCGIPTDSQSVIFDEFHQLGNPERDHSNGLGLGLSIVKRAAELLGLEITVHSAPNVGSTFGVTIPKAQVSTATVSISVDEPVNTIKTISDKLLVIVIDDDIAIREAAERLLQIWKCEVLVAADREEAMAMLAAAPRMPDAIIADYRLRDNDTGVAVIGAISAHYETTIPSVLITGEMDDSQFDSLAENGIKLLKKPVSPAKLRAFLGAIKPPS
jgi:signal transduction histidine kinase